MIVRHVPPTARPYGVSDEEAVELCREWMIYLGAAETVAASGDARELCDLYSSRYLAWVDNRRGNLDLDDVDRAARLSSADGRQGVIFVRAGVLPVARQRADALRLVLLRYDARNGTLDGGNQLGFDLRASGFTD